MKWLLCVCLVALWCHHGLLATSSKQLRLLKDHQERHSTTITVDKDKAPQILEERFRSRRAASDHLPILHGSYAFIHDVNNRAAIQYSGSNSPVILVLTFSGSDRELPFNTQLYRSNNYGANFTLISSQLDSSDPRPALWRDIYTSPIDKNLVIISHSILAKFYYSMDEGATWSVRTLSPATINPRSLLWNPSNDRMALGHDTQNDQLYVTQTLGETWIKIADYVRIRDYQWGDSAHDVDASVVYFNSYDPINRNSDVSLSTQRVPYTSQTQREFDPNLGLHDDFLLLGPYIFAQKTTQNLINLYVSYNRKPFQKALIPSTDAHQKYRVTHIDKQQALVIVEHISGQHNLYLSDITGKYFALSLPDLVFQENFGIDLEVIEGVNGTLMANQYVRDNPREPQSAVRTLISLDNGGNWELVRGPASTNCLPPLCSLHFNMTTAYARTGIYSQASAPGIILAHGNTGTTLDPGDHNLFISRDGGVSWSLTLEGSWGVTVVDHGGLLVVARDYRQTPSRVLRFSCDEGISWRDFMFTETNMTVYGVLTEPGEHTTTVSLYGVKARVGGNYTWDVVTVNFSSVFLRTCSGDDYYSWNPWDNRLAEGCLLGSSVTIQRRVATRCCLIGQDYFRPTGFSICPCFAEDFECDYGYMREVGLSGPCVRDNITVLSPIACGNRSITYTESQGYRKVSGDVCLGGVEETLGPVTRPCCSISPLNGCSRNPPPCAAHAMCINTVDSFVCVCQTSFTGDGLVSGSGCSSVSAQTSGSPSIGLIAVSVLLAVTLFCAVLLGIAALMMYLRLKHYHGGVGVGGIHYNNVPEEEPLTLNPSDQDDDDDDPLLT